tara:strand:- start:2 stop:586 length:585 start_codon:yes stop_codon:yes gene_type:complete
MTGEFHVVNDHTGSWWELGLNSSLVIFGSLSSILLNVIFVYWGVDIFVLYLLTISLILYKHYISSARHVIDAHASKGYRVHVFDVMSAFGYILQFCWIQYIFILGRQAYNPGTSLTAIEGILMLAAAIFFFIFMALYGKFSLDLRKTNIVWIKSKTSKHMLPSSDTAIGGTENYKTSTVQHKFEEFLYKRKNAK